MGPKKNSMKRVSWTGGGWLGETCLWLDFRQGGRERDDVIVHPHITPP